LLAVDPEHVRAKEELVSLGRLALSTGVSQDLDDAELIFRIVLRADSEHAAAVAGLAAAEKAKAETAKAE